MIFNNQYDSPDLLGFICNFFQLNMLVWTPDKDVPLYIRQHGESYNVQAYYIGIRYDNGRYKYNCYVRPPVLHVIDTNGFLNFLPLIIGKYIDVYIINIE